MDGIFGKAVVSRKWSIKITNK